MPTINVLLYTILKKFLFNSYCITIVSDAPIDLHLNSLFTYIIPNRTVDELRDQLLEVSERGCSDYIVNMVDQVLFMTAFDKVSKIGNIRRSDRKVILIPAPGNQSVDAVFSMKEINNIANLLMIIPNNASEQECQEIYDLVTHKFEGPDELVYELIKQPILLDQWDTCKGEFKENANLFPHNMNNLFGKTVKVATFTYKPYVLLNVDTAITPTGRDGLEMRIVEEFCRWVNCSIQILDEWQGQWGEVYENGTGVGIMGSVVEDKADFGMGALYSWYEEFLHLDFSAAEIRSAVTCVAPSPRVLASWAMPLLPFTWNMWYAVLMTLLFASLGLSMAKGSFDGTLITVFGVMISQSQKSAERNWRVRRVTGWLLAAGLILVSAYGAGLASTFTVTNYEPSVDTIQDLVDRKMEWGATHDAWIFSITMSNEPLIKQLVSQFKIHSAEELKRKSFKRSMAFSIEKLPAGYFAIGDYLTQEALEDYTLMLEDFYYEQCVVMMRKSSPYTEKMSALIGRLHQSGLLLTWETQVALKYLNFKVQQEVKLSRLRSDVGFKPLDLHNVVGIFILYGIGVVLSILIFMVENASTKKSGLRIEE
uniref:Ionotropic receptor n=1 Tax=Semiothisa cinerearia TaxID=2249628 RepID=A0A889XLC4_9NEOP|nr:ionotropic receptor [Semiothisa cinerearia]